MNLKQLTTKLKVKIAIFVSAVEKVKRAENTIVRAHTPYEIYSAAPIGVFRANGAIFVLNRFLLYWNSVVHFCIGHFERIFVLKGIEHYCIGFLVGIFVFGN